MKKIIIPSLKTAFLLFYTINLIYFSSVAFFKSVPWVDINLHQSAYSHFTIKKNVREIFHLFRLNSAFAFFGKGLFASAYVEFDYVNKEANSSYKRSYPDKFLNNQNARIRAAALGTTLSFRLATPLRLSMDELERLNESKADHTQIETLQREIDKKEKSLSKILKQLGEATRDPQVMSSCFDANFYYILPNSVDSKSTDRKLYKVYNYTFCPPQT